MVGGATRDFLISQTISKDLDFEIKIETHLEDDEWLNSLRNTFLEISKLSSLIFEEVGVGVFATSVCSFELEFSSPRQEFFTKGSMGHKNFKPNFISNLNSQSAFARRDFTINAIAFKFDFLEKGNCYNLSLIDPFNGKKDIEVKVLRNINLNFYRDPVRFLRLIRFKNKLGFKPFCEMIDRLGMFDLTELSIFYLKREYYKSRSKVFFKDMYNYIDKYKIKTSDDISSLRFLYFDNPEYINWTAGFCEQLIAFRSNISLEEKISAAALLGLKNKVVKKLHKLFVLIELEGLKLELDKESLKLFDELLKLDFINLKMLSFTDNLCKYKLLKVENQKINSKENFEKYQSDLLLQITRKKTPK